MDYISIKPRFDDVLQSHFERLIGTRVGMRGLPITLETITALALLAERLEDGEDDPSKLHTKESLRNEMADVGLESADLIEEALQYLEEKGYYQALESGGLEPLEDVSTMSGALDKVFPQMPGMLLVAYLVQTLQEVMTGRKEVDHAVDQFDQALTMHGMSAKKDKPAETKPAAPPAGDDVAKKRLASLRKLSAARTAAARQKQAAAFPMANLDSSPQEQSPVESQENQNITGFTPVEPVESTSPPVEEEVSVEEPVAEVEPAETAGMEEVRDTAEEETQPEDEQIEEEPLPEEDETEEAPEEEEPEEEDPEDIEPPDEEEPDPIEAVEEESEPEPEPEPPEPEPEQPEAPEIGDADIMERVAQFEEALAMTCPLCGEGKVKEQQTSMGKTFFACTQKSCQFISWGRPHHIPCPLCSNPFLVEGTAIEGSAILKCPRATCSHAQPIGAAGAAAEAPKKKKKRRVVRRRVAKK